MRLPLPSLTFPVLVKDLSEQAARKRTYILRTIYAVLLFGIACLYIHERFSYTSNAFDVLGTGRTILEMIVGVQFVGIYIFLPILMAGAIAQEKENSTITLLLLTDLRPWEIIIQKYISRLTPMFTFLLLSLPLLGIAYALGGITILDLVNSVWLLTLCCLQVGAFCLMTSAFTRSTANAFIASYILGLAFYFGPAFIVLGLCDELFHIIHVPARMQEWFLCHIPPYHFADNIIIPWGGTSSFTTVLIRTLPITVSIPLLLLLARFFFVRKALATPGNLILGIFRSLDRFFNRINKKTTGGIVLVPDRISLPDDKPIHWLETSTRSLGKFRYLFRISIATMVPTMMMILFVVMLGDLRYGGQTELLSITMLFLLWPVAVLILAVQSAGSIATERSRQTMDVLLTTPIESPDIIKQKIAATNQLFIVLASPIAVTIGFEFFLEDMHRSLLTESTGWIYLIGSALSILIYLRMITWLAMLVSLICRKQILAIIATLLTIIAWCAVPWIILIILDELMNAIFDIDDFPLLTILSPATFIPINEFYEYEHGMYKDVTPWTFLIANFTLYTAVLLLIRTIALRKANRFLNRA